MTRGHFFPPEPPAAVITLLTSECYSSLPRSMPGERACPRICHFGGRCQSLVLDLIFFTKQSSWTGLPSSVTFDWSSVMALPQIAQMIGGWGMDMAVSVRGLSVGRAKWIVLGQEGQSHADFFLVFPDDRLQK